ncbi:MAG: metallopeptidase family protein [Actinomycetota bacterium]
MDLAPVVSDDAFEDLVADALDGLPDWVRERLDNVDVLIAPAPPPDHPGLLGLYEGIPLTRRGYSYSGVLPDRITLFRSSILYGARTEEEVRKRVRHTVVHEIAHFFGISDDRLREIDRY